MTYNPPGQSSPQSANDTPHLALSLDLLLAISFCALLFFLPLKGTKFGYVETKIIVYLAWAASTSLTCLSPATRRMDFLFLAVWTAIVAGMYVMGRGFSGRVHLETTMLCGMLFVMGSYYAESNSRAFKVLAATIICIMAGWCAWGLPRLLVAPWLPRVLTGNGSQDFALYAKLGIGGYADYTAIAMVLPFFYGIALSFKSWRRWGLLLCCLPLFVSAFFTTLAGTLLLATVGTALFVFLVLVTKKKYLLLLLLAMGISLLLTPYLSSLFSGQQIKVTLRDSDENASLFAPQKLMRLFSDVRAAGLVAGDETGRGYLMTLSWHTFVNHPWIGVGPHFGSPEESDLVGGHSSWVDTLAEYGVLGFTWFLIFAGMGVSRVVRLWRTHAQDPILTGAMIFCGMYAVYGFMNPVLFLPEISLLVFFVFGAVTWPRLATLPSHLGGRAS